MGQTTVVDPVTGKSREKYKNLRDEESGPLARIEGTMIIRFEEGLFFGNVGQLKERLKRIEVHGDLGIHPGEEPRTFSGTTPTAGSLSGAMYAWEDQTVSQPAPGLITQRLHGVVFDMKSVSEIDARFDM